MNIIEILKAARDLISDPEHWTQHVMAKSREKMVTDALGPDAHCFCASGAIMRQTAAPEKDRIAAIRALNAGIPASFPQEHCQMTRVIQYNDLQSHSEVMAMFDVTIEKLHAHNPLQL